MRIRKVKFHNSNKLFKFHLFNEKKIMVISISNYLCTFGDVFYVPEDFNRSIKNWFGSIHFETLLNLRRKFLKSHTAFKNSNYLYLGWNCYKSHSMLKRDHLNFIFISIFILNHLCLKFSKSYNMLIFQTVLCTWPTLCTLSEIF